MDAVFTQSSLILPPGWKLPPHEWRRLAIRRPRRRDLVATRRIIDKVRRDEVPPALGQVAHSPLPLVLRFVHCLPDVDYALIAQDAAGYVARCSRDLTSVRQVVLDALDWPHGSRLVEAQPLESRRIAQRRERACRAMELLLERLVERRDLSIVVAWRLAGDSDANLDCSEEMDAYQRHRWLTWFAGSVLGVKLDLPADAASSLDWLKSKLEAG